MVDRDQKEIKAIKTVFPHASVLLCWFHVLQAIHRWVVKQDGGHVQDPAVRNIIVQGIFSLKQCRTERVFHETAKRVLEQIKTATGATRVSKYLRETWLQCGAMWANFGRMFFHHQSETNNVVERFFNGLKYNFLGGYCNKRLDDLLLILHNHVVKYYSQLDELVNAGRAPTKGSQESVISAERMRSHGLDQNIQYLSEARFSVPSESKPDVFYEVDLLYSVCQCPVNGQGQKCKHIVLAQMVSDGLIDTAALREDTANMLCATNSFVSDETTVMVQNGENVGIVNLAKQQCSCLASSYGEVCVCLLVANKISESTLSTTASQPTTTVDQENIETESEPPVHQAKYCIKDMIYDLRNWCESEEYQPSLDLYTAVKHTHQLAFGRFKTVFNKRKTERLHKYRKHIELSKRRIANYSKTDHNKRQIQTVHHDGAFKRRRRQRTRN
ncbi:uncharacterized protein LOC130205117 isoform X2 [Pseudoliparis swirei]|nr:uncharacterized protein LOC130205117 isoform X2 [Pseudoliparis swirei]